MRKSFWALVLLATCAGTSSACTCILSGDDEAADWRRHWNDSHAVVIAEIVGQSSEPVTAWFSRNHVIGHSSPLRHRPLLQLVVRHRWKGQLMEGTVFVANKVEGAACGYESWERSRYHLLYLKQAKHWVASLCGLSEPVLDVTSAIKQQDAMIARLPCQQSKPAQR